MDQVNFDDTKENNHVAEAGDDSLDTSVCPVVALSTPDNVKLLQQFESILNRTIECNKYQSKTTLKT